VTDLVSAAHNTRLSYPKYTTKPYFHECYFEVDVNGWPGPTTIFYAYNYYSKYIFHRQLQFDTKTASFCDEKVMKRKWLNDFEQLI